MQIGVIGVNYKLANVGLREMIARACQRRFFLGNPLKEGTFVLLSTCNRSELYFSAVDMVQTHQHILAILKEEIEQEFEQKLYSFFGIDCFLHLARVTIGLDSAIIAETEIQGQVRLAYDAAMSLRTLCKELHFLFQKCLKIGKEIRSNHLPVEKLPGLEQALLFHTLDFFKHNVPPILFIGASGINIKIARFFKRRGYHHITFCNRSEESCFQISQEIGSHILQWHDLADNWTDFECVVCATKSPHYILTEAQDSPKKRLLIDLAVPRNIDPKLESEETTLLNIDQLQQSLDTRRLCLKQQVALTEKSLLVMVSNQITNFQLRCHKMAVNS